MSSSLQTVLEQPLRFSTGAFQATESGGDGRSAVLLREVSLIDSGMTPQSATLMAVATDHADGAGPERAERALERFQAAVVDGTQTDMAARLKSSAWTLARLPRKPPCEIFNTTNIEKISATQPLRLSTRMPLKRSRK